MSRLPRVAVGTIQPGADRQAMSWALMEAFQRSGLQVQSFLSRACFPAHQGAATITGLTPRHLDSWLMSPEICRSVFVRGAEAADLSLVEGQFDSAVTDDGTGGRLETVCRWLELPKLVVLDASQIGRCRLPDRPESLEGVLVDRVIDDGHLSRLTTDLEALWAVPVLGALEQLPHLRAQLDAVPSGQRLPRELCRKLGDNFVGRWRPDRLGEIIKRREVFDVSVAPRYCDPEASEFTLAVAYDEVFNCYFPCTLDLLESLGMSVVDFSPLRDESLPPGTDVVYLGCGHAERFAAALSENHCMKAALRSHLTAGGRIYGEGGGAAYLCQQMETPGGQLKRMVGIFPAVARLRRPPTAPLPVEITLARPNWLGEKGSQLRGYRNSHWDFEPVGALAESVTEEDQQHELLGSFHAVGSLLHLNFAAQPDFLRQFFRPRVPCPDTPDPWNAVS